MKRIEKQIKFINIKKNHHNKYFVISNEQRYYVIIVRFILNQNGSKSFSSIVSYCHLTFYGTYFFLCTYVQVTAVYVSCYAIGRLLAGLLAEKIGKIKYIDFFIYFLIICNNDTRIMTTMKLEN